MMYTLFSLVLLISKPTAAPSTQPAAPENKALTAVMDARAKQIEVADRLFKNAVDSARKTRDQAVDAANKNAAKTLIVHARNSTQAGKLAEAVNTYKLICRFDPTNPEAMAALKAVGIDPEVKPAPEGGPATPADGGNAGSAAAGGNPHNALPPKPRAVEYTWQRVVQCPVDSPQWTTIVQLTEGQSVDFTVTGTWRLGGKELGPQGTPAEGIVLRGRMSTQPNKTFVIEPKCTFKAAVAGMLQVSMSMPDTFRKDAKGSLEIMAGIRK